MGLVQHAPVGGASAPAVSVCIANYNGEGLLPACLDAVLAQLDAPGIEIIVHDDASDDRSVELLRRTYPQVTLLESHENVGFCIANNRMVDVARGEYVLLLNNDAELFVDGVATLFRAARAAPAPAILTLPQYDRSTGELVDRGCHLDLSYNPVPNLDPARDRVAYVIGACLWIPRALWHDLGGFPGWMGSLAEDMYLGCAARLQGFDVRALPSSGYHHVQGATFGGNAVRGGGLVSNVRRRVLSERNKSATLFLCTPTAIVWPWFALHVLALLLEGVALALLTRDGRAWREVYRPVLAALPGMPRQLAARRRALQSRRCISLARYLRVFTPLPRKLVLLLRYGPPRLR